MQGETIKKFSRSLNIVIQGNAANPRYRAISTVHCKSKSILYWEIVCIIKRGKRNENCRSQI